MEDEKHKDNKNKIITDQKSIFEFCAEFCETKKILVVSYCKADPEGYVTKVRE